MRILIGYNGSDLANDALSDLLRAGLPDRVEAKVLSVAEVSFPTQNLDDATRLAGLAADLIQKNFPNWSITAEAVSGSPPREILAMSETFRPDLIVVGERRQTSSEGYVFLGQTTKTILTESNCSVRVARKAQNEGEREHHKCRHDEK